mgnify:CR=1 FL=1
MTTKKRKYNLTSPAAPSIEDWQCEDDLRTLQRAEEIEADPKRIAKVKAMARAQPDALMKTSVDKD